MLDVKQLDAGQPVDRQSNIKLSKKDYKSIISSASQELADEGRLSTKNLESILEIANLPMPKVWPCNSYRFKAIKILREDSKDIVKHWKTSYMKKLRNMLVYLDGLSGREKKRQFNAMMNVVYFNLDSSLENAVSIYSKDRNLGTFHLEFKKGLYSNIGRYLFLEEMPEHHFVKLINGVKDGSELSLFKLYRMKRKKLLPNVDNLHISWKDKETLVKLALYDAAKSISYLGGFDIYARKCLKGQVRKFFKDMSTDEKAYSYRKELEREIADTSTIKLFDAATYEEILERSEFANAYHGYIRTSLSPYPEKLNEKISNLVNPKGDMIAEYLKVVLPELRIVRVESNIIELFRKKYSHVDEKQFYEVMNACLTGKADENVKKLFDKDKSELLTRELSKRLPKMERVYLSIVSRILTPIEYNLSCDALSMPYEEFTAEGVIHHDVNLESRLENIKDYAIEAAKKFRGFELLPMEVKEDAVSSKIHGEEFKIHSLNDPKRIVVQGLGDICLIAEHIAEISKYGNVRDIMQAFYENDYLLLDAKSNRILDELYFKTISIKDGKRSIFSVSGCALDYLAQKLGDDSSYNIVDTVEMKDTSFKVFSEKDAELVLSQGDVYGIKGNDDLKIFLSRLEDGRAQAIELKKKYMENRVGISYIIPEPYLKNLRLANGRVIFKPSSLFSGDDRDFDWDYISNTFESYEAMARNTVRDNMNMFDKCKDELSMFDDDEVSRLRQLCFDKGWETVSKEYNRLISLITPLENTIENNKQSASDDIPF